ncbi:A-kinase anchor protein 6, partial [Takifugu flavidus]
SSHVELTMMEAKKTSLLSRAETLKRSQNGLPGNLHHKIHNLTHTWKQLEKILSEHSGSGSQRTQSANPKSSLLEVHRDVLENPRSSLSPLTNALLEQLEARIKELKVWLRDTELLIFNSCLREHKDAAQQLQSFKVAAGWSLLRETDVWPDGSHQGRELLHVQEFFNRRQLGYWWFNELVDHFYSSSSGHFRLHSHVLTLSRSVDVPPPRPPLPRTSDPT